jgi:hypothetical protein
MYIFLRFFPRFLSFLFFFSLFLIFHFFNFFPFFSPSLRLFLIFVRLVYLYTLQAFPCWTYRCSPGCHWRVASCIQVGTECSSDTIRSHMSKIGGSWNFHVKGKCSCQWLGFDASVAQSGQNEGILRFWYPICYSYIFFFSFAFYCYGKTASVDVQYKAMSQTDNMSFLCLCVCVCVCVAVIL